MHPPPTARPHPQGRHQFQLQRDAVAAPLSALERDSFAAAGHSTPARGAAPPASGNASTLIFDEEASPSPRAQGDAAAPAAAEQADGAATAAAARPATPTPAGAAGSDGFSTPNHPRRKGPKSQLTPPPLSAPAAAGGAGAGASPFTPLSHRSGLSLREDLILDEEEGQGEGGGGSGKGGLRSPVRWRSNPSARLSFEAAKAGAAAGGALEGGVAKADEGEGPEGPLMKGEEADQPDGPAAQLLTIERRKRAALEAMLSRVLEGHQQQADG